MSDECLMKQETVISFYIVYQDVMRKFTIAGKAYTQRKRIANSLERKTREKFLGKGASDVHHLG